MSATERGGLKAAFTNFKKAGSEEEAERKLLGRTVEVQPEATTQTAGSYQTATNAVAGQSAGLTPRPLLRREAVRQLSFRCPVSVAAELKRKAAFNQLEQQEIIVEALKRILAELPTPPEEWREE